MRGHRHWQHRFRDNVARWTFPREAILDMLSRSPGHPSAKDIYASLYPLYPGIGLTTVYRNLDLLHQLGVVRKINAGDGQSRYQLVKEGEKDHYHHLICTRCGRIIDYRDFAPEEMELIKKTEEALARKYNFLITGHNLEFFGLCEKCR